ncbi:MAG: lactoylglutathione lyase [Candidatus Thiodiazotropha taylori]
MKRARILHTMLRVGDMERSVEFYTKVLGMRVLRTLDQAVDHYSLTFLGYGEETDTAVLELTYNYGVSVYEMGSAYGHIAIGVEDCQAACNEVVAKGGDVMMLPQRLKGSDETIAFVRDPDGYHIELVEHADGEWLGESV